MTLDRRARGWLSPLIHSRLREILVHLSAKYHLACPAYCLMPDHGHFLFMGCQPQSDQLRAARLLRTHWNTILPAGFRLQKQGYDHVLLESEREQNAFQGIAHYILKNPERSGLIRDGIKYPYSGSILAGYPSLQPDDEGFWKSFWIAFGKMTSQP